MGRDDGGAAWETAQACSNVMGKARKSLRSSSSRSSFSNGGRGSRRPKGVLILISQMETALTQTKVLSEPISDRAFLPSRALFHATRVRCGCPADLGPENNLQTPVSRAEGPCGQARLPATPAGLHLKSDVGLAELPASQRGKAASRQLSAISPQRRNRKIQPNR